MADFTFSTTILVPPDVIHHHLTNAAALQQFFCQSAYTRSQEGGPVLLNWDAQGYYTMGHYTALRDDHIAFTWHGNDDPGPSHVEIAIADKSIEVTRTSVTVTHTLGEGEEWETTRERISELWREGMGNLRSRTQTGADLRSASRPFLGVLPVAPINAERGLPIEHGIEISGVLPGTGAEEAGLQPRDVLHKLNGTVLEAFPAFRAALGGTWPGETVELVFYRGAEEHTVPLRLSHPLTVSIPDTPEALAADVAARHADIMRELHAVLDGVSEEVAARAPAEGEWSAIDVIAHLLHNQRYLHQLINAALWAYQGPGFEQNSPHQLAVLREVYPTMEAVLTAFDRAQQQTVALIRHVPEGTPKAVLNDIGQNAIGMAGHTRSHFLQIREAVEGVAV